MKVTLSENNSGGSWRLDRQQYEALFAAGWAYEPSEYDIDHGYDGKPLFGGKTDTVPYGWRHGTKGEFQSLREAVESFERVTGEDFLSEGCNCCGSPFTMSTEENGLRVHQRGLRAARGRASVVRMLTQKSRRS